MKKVIYVVTKVTKGENLKFKGIGYLTEKDLLTVSTTKDNKPYISIYEDCLKDCHPVNGSKDEFKGCYYELAEYEGHEYQKTYYIWYKLVA